MDTSNINMRGRFSTKFLVWATAFEAEHPGRHDVISALKSHYMDYMNSVSPNQSRCVSRFQRYLSSANRRRFAAKTAKIYISLLGRIIDYADRNNWIVGQGRTFTHIERVEAMEKMQVQIEEESCTITATTPVPLPTPTPTKDSWSLRSTAIPPLQPRKCWGRDRWRVSFDITPAGDGYYTVQCREIPALITQATSLENVFPAIGDLIIDAV